MAFDIRLDFITNIDEEYINKMTEIREKFINLDQELQKINDEMNRVDAGFRSISLSRANLETALMYAIKALAILGEK